MPPRRQSNSRGAELAARLDRARHREECALRAGARTIPVVTGLTPGCVARRPLENILTEAQHILHETKRVFRYGNSVVLEVHEDGDARLAVLSTGPRVESTAPAQMANSILCETPDAKGNPQQFPLPLRFVEILLNREPTLACLPLIKTYASRPVFDEEFNLRGPGWHADVGILVHGLDIEPVALDEPDPNLPIMERLPPHIRQLLSDFCLKSDADIANAVALLVTGMLITHFIVGGKPVALLDGNQPGVGKTLLARVIGMVLDGEDPQIIHYTPDDEELQKRICATLRGSRQSQILIDNAKIKSGGSVESPTIEANSMASVISLRILGTSENYTRPNDLLWFLTMNDTKASPDLVSRALPIRFYYEGDPKDRTFEGRNPIAYAKTHRAEILSEVAGMVVTWNQRGRLQGPQNHRLPVWSRTVGGIMCANGLPEFLGNLDEAAAEFNSALDALAALAEAVIKAGDDQLAITGP